MADTKHFDARDARDRLIDLLGFGKTFPLRDAAVRSERLTVPVDTPARIPIDNSQRGVRYRLIEHRTGEGVEGSGEAGTGGTIHLVTPKIPEDITYDILAGKVEATLELGPREAYLRQLARVRVGLDVTLDARIRRLPPLEPRAASPKDSDARIAHYGSAVEVEIDASQEGVMYTLIDAADQERKLSPTPVRGDGKDIVLKTEPLGEDTDLRIRATKTFDPSESRETQTAVLGAVFSVKVRANPAIRVSIEPPPIVGFGQDALIKLAATQRSVRYRLYARPIRDGEFLYAEPAGEALAVTVPGNRQLVRVHGPERPDPHALWRDVAGFEPLGEPISGSGGDLTLRAPRLTRDSVILVRARKDHRNGVIGRGDAPAPGTIPSAVQLRQALMVLVQPNPEQPLALRVWIEGTESSGAIEVSNGQPGVFYQFRTDPRADPLGLPVYFHQKDDENARLNKGLGQLRLEVDFAIARDQVNHSAAAYDSTATLPPPPLLVTKPLPVGTLLQVRASKAQTGVSVPFTRTAQLAGVPEIRAEPPQVGAGAAAKILVVASRAGERYRLTLNGEEVATLDGDGTTLEFDPGAIQVDTTFAVAVSQPGGPGIPLERVVSVSVTVRDD